MASTWPTEIALLRDLVAMPSVSGAEEAVARYLEDFARGQGLDVVRDETSVRIAVGDEASGPTLAFTSHLDVVPPGDGWTRDPFVPTIEGDLLYGRGSGDAKASVAAMVSALVDLTRQPPVHGRVLGIFSYGEETRNATMSAAVPRAGRLDAAIIGEPTNLQPAVAQRGLMMVDLVAHGDQRHAGYADLPGFRNAIVALAEELIRLETVAADRVHPMLGRTTITPTMLTGGISRNVTPPMARAVLDIRSTPDWTHDELAAVLTEALRCDVEITSTRLVPCETPPNSRLLAAIQATWPAAMPYGSPTCSDWCFLRHLDAVKIGPGTSRRSHTPDECVDLPEVTAARQGYADLARRYLA